MFTCLRIVFSLYLLKPRRPSFRLFYGNFYGLDGTLDFICEALDAVFCSDWISLLLRSWMPRSIRPVKHVHRTDIDTDPKSSAGVPVNSHICSVNTKLFRRLHRSPYIMTLMLTHNFPTLLEIRIYTQNISPILGIFESRKI